MQVRVLVVILALALCMLCSFTEGRNKKVVIHVPYKVKKIRHTHTVYRTIHHHHPAREQAHFMPSVSAEEHEHFHHVHLHPDGNGQASQAIPGIGIPEFLPDVPIEVGMGMEEIPDIPRQNRFAFPFRQIPQ